MKTRLFYLSLLFLIGTGGFTFSFAEFTCIWHTTGAQPNSMLGYSLVGVGDQNQDGYGDFIALNYGTDEVFLYYGGPVGQMDTIPDLIFYEPGHYEFDCIPNRCGDWNGDGYIDILIVADCFPITPATGYIYFGGPSLDNVADVIVKSDSLCPGGYFGIYSTTGDINGDGYDDLLINARSYWYPGEGIDEGKIFIYYGGPDFDSIPDFSITGQLHNYALFGNYIYSGFDVNNDNFDDFICSGWISGSGHSESKFMFLGGNPLDSTIDWMYDDYNHIMRGQQVLIPDVNNDGYDEIILASRPGGLLYYGGAVVDTIQDVFLDGITGWQGGFRYIGDVNGDGYPDVMNGDGYANLVNIFFLGPNMGDRKYADLSYGFLNIVQTNFLGDIDGNGVDDFALVKYFNQTPGEIFIYSDTSLSQSVRPKIEPTAFEFTLSGVYPNPFNQQIALTFNLPRKGEINLQIYNILGRKVYDLSKTFNAGSARLLWEGKDKSGAALSSGIYFLRISDGRKAELRKILLMK